MVKIKGVEGKETIKTWIGLDDKSRLPLFREGCLLTEVQVRCSSLQENMQSRDPEEIVHLRVEGEGTALPDPKTVVSHCFSKPKGGR